MSLRKWLAIVNGDFMQRPPLLVRIPRPAAVTRLGMTGKGPKEFDGEVRGVVEAAEVGEVASSVGRFPTLLQFPLRILVEGVRVPYTTLPRVRYRCISRALSGGLPHRLGCSVCLAAC